MPPNQRRDFQRVCTSSHLTRTSSSLPRLVLPQVPLPVAAFAVDAVPTVLSGDTAHRACSLCCSATTEGALVLQETVAAILPGPWAPVTQFGDKAEIILSIRMDLSLRGNVPSLPLCIRLLPLAQCSGPSGFLSFLASPHVPGDQALEQCGCGS